MCIKDNLKIMNASLSAAARSFTAFVCFATTVCLFADVALDVDTLTDEQMKELNLCGTQFGMGKKAYIK